MIVAVFIVAAVILSSVRNAVRQHVVERDVTKSIGEIANAQYSMLGAALVKWLLVDRFVAGIVSDVSDNSIRVCTCDFVLA